MLGRFLNQRQQDQTKELVRDSSLDNILDTFDEEHSK
jgi:hypothetical protein